MARCPAGHDSTDRDFCDVCGTDMAGAAAGALQAEPGTGSASGTPAGTAAETCPRCDTPRSGRFCEEDGYDFVLNADRPPHSSRFTTTAQLNVATPVTPTIPSAATKLARNRSAGKPGRGWRAVITADREYYDKVMAEGGPDAAVIAFPPYYPDRVVPLTGNQVRIGRRSVSRGVTPEVDLSEPPEDVGVSHIHAVLLARPDGTWVLVDPGSTNGTTVNGSTDPIAVNAEIPVGDGDRIHVGAWTTITLRRE
jgi:hypothetical protein